MGTFNLCDQNNKSKTIILNYKFDSNITNNIVSFLDCNSCRRMKTYEDIYSDKTIDNLSKIQKQIHCLFSFFNDDYTKLKNLREKKKFFKEIIDRSDCHKKTIVKRFLSNSGHIYMIDFYIEFFLENNLGYFSYIFDRRLNEEEITFRPISEPLGYVFNVFLACYLKHLIGFLSEKYFDITEILLHIMVY